MMTDSPVPGALRNGSAAERGGDAMGDIMDSFGKYHQFLPAPVQPMRENIVVAGRAMPALIIDLHGPQRKPFGHLTESLDALAAGEVYIAGGGGMRCACWGEILTVAARARGALGAVVDGYHRDPPKKMKPKNPIALLSGLLALTLAPIHAAKAENSRDAAANVRETGNIGGRVVNAVTGLHLNNARVTVQGTDLRVFSDETGRLRLLKVPSGNVVIEVFYTGLNKQENSIKVPAGQTITWDVYAPLGATILPAPPRLRKRCSDLRVETSTCEAI